VPPTPDPVYRAPAGPVVSQPDEVDLPAARVGEPEPGGSSAVAAAPASHPAPSSETSVATPHRPARTPEGKVAASHPSPDADAPTGSTAAQREGTSPGRRVLRRRVRLVRRQLGPGPYLDYDGELLAQLAAHGSASAFVADPARAEAVRREAPGCPVHTNPDAIPAGVFRGVLAVTAEPPDAATLATWRRVLIPDAGRVLLIGVAPESPGAAGFTVRWTGRERWRSGPAVVVLEVAPGRMIEP
jgi:hypothetical protein